MSISPAVDAAMRGEVIRTAALLLLDFADEREYLALGTQDLRLNGILWRGTQGKAVSISPIRAVYGAAAAKQEIYVSGVDPKMMARGLNAIDLVKGRAMTLFRARFDADWQLLGTPKAIFNGTMEDVTFEGDGTRRSLILGCENLLARKRIARNAYLTDADIQARNPGDLFGQYIASHADKTVQGPVSV